MAQGLLDFFDEDFFSEACTCGNSSVTGQVICNVHVNTVKSPLLEDTIQEKKEVDSSRKDWTVPQVDINQSFPRQPTQDHLVNQIEYRIRILSNHETVIKPGEIKRVQSNVSVTRKAGKLSLWILTPDGIPLRFISEGILDPAFRGRLSVQFENPTSEEIHLPAGCNVGYLVMTPFMQ